MTSKEYEMVHVQDSSEKNLGLNENDGNQDGKDLEQGENIPSPTPSVPFLTQLFELFFVSNESHLKEETNIPEMTFLELFGTFLWFGLRAFGGPVAQIALMKQEIITRDKWISNERFTRVYSVYQILPGPEAMELACYFGYLAKGRLGSLVGGLGFLLPGFLMMLLCSFLYVKYGIQHDVVQRTFRCLQCVVAASIFKATYKLSDGALKDAKTKQFSYERGFLFFFCFLTSVIGLNFFISLGVAGIMNTIFEWHRKEETTNEKKNNNTDEKSKKETTVTEKLSNKSEQINESKPTLIQQLKELCKLYLRDILVGCVACLTIGLYILYVCLEGIPGGSLIGSKDSSSVSGTSYSSLLALGLVAGCVTFGGAYTTFPFIYAAAVQGGQWLSDTDFLAAVAIVNILPTPLVTFVTLVGYIGHGVGGAILITIGIFLPAFSFTLIGHNIFEKIVNNPLVHPFFDGVGAAVIGLLLQTAFQFVKNVISTPIDSISFLLAFAALFHFTDRNTPVYCMIVGAIAGQVLYQ